MVGGVRLWLLREGAGGGMAIDSGEEPVSFVCSIRFAVGLDFLFSGSTSSVKTMADRVTSRLSSMSSMRAVAISFFPCHQWCGSADVRSAVLVDRRHGSAVLAPAAVSKVWSCAPTMAGGSWPGVYASRRVGGRRGDGWRCVPELGTAAEAAVGREGLKPPYRCNLHEAPPKPLLQI